MTARRIVGWMLLLGLAYRPAGAAPEDLPQSGSWALEFQMRPVSGASEYGIATKVHLSDRSAARLGFLVGLGSSDGGGSGRESIVQGPDSLSMSYAYETASDQHSGSVFLHYVGYATLAEHFGLSLDAGPVFGWSWSKYTERDPGSPPYTAAGTYTTESNQKSYGFEVQGGFEWHFTRRLALAGRYGLSALRNEGRGESSSDTYNPSSGSGYHRERVQSSDGFTVQTTSSVFSLIAYW